MSYAVVLVEWVDAEANNEWTNISDVNPDTPAQVQSAGFLISVTDQFIVVTTTVSNDQTNAYMRIPVSCIASWRTLTNVNEQELVEKLLKLVLPMGVRP